MGKISVLLNHNLLQINPVRASGINTLGEGEGEVRGITHLLVSLAEIESPTLRLKFLPLDQI